MSYTVIVEVKVVNTMGEVVDSYGYPDMGNPNRKHFPLKTEQRFVTFEGIEKAHESLNALHAVVKQMKELP
jgi:hypothetical protein